MKRKCDPLMVFIFLVINFVDYSLNQGAPAGHESAETPIGHESNGAVAGDESNGAVAGDESNGAVAGDVVHAILNTIAEKAMNFMSYMAEVSRGWDEPNARDMGRMMSQPNAKGEMYILNDNIDMRTKFAAMARRLEKLEMTNMQPVQAISQTPLQAMPCAICLSYEHLVDECPTIPQASNLKQAIVNLSKIVGDFVELKKPSMLNSIKELTEWRVL
ncbi:hypothetical protein AAG906_020900 [Vitis piasezkii]